MNRDKEQVDKGWERMKVLLEEELPPSSTPLMRFGWWSTLATLVVVVGSAIPHYRTPLVPFRPPKQELAVSTDPSLKESVDPLNNPQFHSSALPKSALKQKQVGLPVVDHGQPVSLLSSEASTIQLPVLPKKIAVLQGLPGQSLHPLSSPVLAPARTVQPVRPHRSNIGKVFRPGLLLGANFFQVKQLPGFVGGLTLDLGPAHQRWGVQTGLLYRSQVYAGESRPVIPVTYQQFQAATGHTDQDLTNLPNSSLLINTANRMLVPVIRSHQLETPLLLFFSPVSKSRLYAGATFMRHIWIESADRSLFTYDLRVVQNPSSATTGKLSNELINQLSPWERNWQLGLSYTFFRKVEVGLFYRSTMRPVPALADVSRLFDKCYNCSLKYPEAEQRTQESLRPQAVQLNLRYQF